ncbi:MAG: hypothetical protein ACLGHI_10370 [Gammaproteobacteria bacterium]
MKKYLVAGSLLALFTGPVLAAEVGVSIRVGDPDFYGEIHIGDYPQPQLIYAEPVIIQRAVVGGPLYLRVPPGHAKNWGKHCAQYNACGRPTYFVRDEWYQGVYVPAHRAKHKGGKGKGPGGGPGKGNGK